MILVGLEYASDGPELSNEEIERQLAELESKLSLRLRAGYARRVETIGLSGESDPKKKIASI